MVNFIKVAPLKMTDDFIFKHRNILKKHKVDTSKVLLYGYHGVSDAAKITYQVIDGHDWENESGEKKGEAWPHPKRLAWIRGKAERTIQRHIAELEQAKLLTRIRRRNRCSILYIEDISNQEAQKYIKRFIPQRTTGSQRSTRPPKLSVSKEEKREATSHPRGRTRSYSRNDIFVVSEFEQETTKMTVPNKVYRNNLEINVNDDLSIRERKGNTTTLAEILKSYQKPETETTVKSESISKRDYVATEIAAALDDGKSLGCYRLLADKIPEQVLFEISATVKQYARAGKVRKTPGALFVDQVKRYATKRGIQLGLNHPPDNPM